MAPATVWSGRLDTVWWNEHFNISAAGESTLFQAYKSRFFNLGFNQVAGRLTK